MNNDFKKLDAFMGKHAPQAALTSRPLKQQYPWMGQSLLAMGLACLIIFGIFMKGNNENESALVLYQTLSLDLTESEMPELEEVTSFLE